MFVPDLNTLVEVLAYFHDSLFKDERSKSLKPSKEKDQTKPAPSELVILDNDTSRGELFFKEDLNSSFNLSPEPKGLIVPPKIPASKKNPNQLPAKSSIATPETCSNMEIRMVVIDEVGSLVYDLDKGFDHCTPATKAVGSILAKITREKYIPIVVTSSVAVTSEEVKIGLSPWANFTGDTILTEKCVFKEPYDPVKAEANQQERKQTYQIKKVINSGVAGFYMQVPAESKPWEGTGDASHGDMNILTKTKEFVLKFRVKLSLLSQAQLNATRIDLNFEKKLHLA